MDGLIAKQIEEHNLMSRAFTNLKKKGGQSSQGTIQAYLEGLEKKWIKLETRHDSILDLKTPENASINYFQGNFLQVAEETYLEEKGKFLDALQALNSSKGTLSSPNVRVEPTRTTYKLPNIEITPFSGKYSDWPSFKDYFTALIANDGSLEDVERMHYLKTFLKGEAANLIKNIPVTGDNYDRAWNRVSSHYDSKRNLIQHCLDAFFQLKPMQLESHRALKQLRDGTMETIETLQALGRPVKHMDDLLVYLTVQRLDAQTRRDWELSLGESADPLTWEELDKFLKRRIHALERSEPLKSATLSENLYRTKKTTASYSNKLSTNNPKVTAHTATKSKTLTCLLCHGEHYLNACDQFRAYSIDNRSKFVSENQLCQNCLGKHNLNDCRSKYSCHTCRKRHHTLLHYSPGASTSTSLSTSKHPELDASPKSQTEHQVTGVSALTVTAKQSGPVLLATARLNVSSDHQRCSSTRALIDPCSEVSFIAESMAQRLKLKRKSTFVPVTGIVAVHGNTAKSKASVTISPHFESTKSWRLMCLIIPRLTDYLPAPRLIMPSLTFIDGLCLADSHPESSDTIEMIVGVDGYTRLIEEGLHKSPCETTIAQATGLGWIITGSTSPISVPISETSLPLTSL